MSHDEEILTYQENDHYKVIFKKGICTYSPVEESRIYFMHGVSVNINNELRRISVVKNNYDYNYAPESKVRAATDEEKRIYSSIAKEWDNQFGE